MLDRDSKIFKTLPFEDAVKLFREWGFQVEPGPRADEITLISEGPDYRNYSVYPAGLLPQIAAATLNVRWRNGAMAQVAAQGPQGIGKRANFKTMPLPIRTHSQLVH